MLAPASLRGTSPLVHNIFRPLSPPCDSWKRLLPKNARLQCGPSRSIHKADGVPLWALWQFCCRKANIHVQIPRAWIPDLFWSRFGVPETTQTEIGVKLDSNWSCFGVPEFARTGFGVKLEFFWSSGIRSDQIWS